MADETIVAPPEIKSGSQEEFQQILKAFNGGEQIQRGPQGGGEQAPQEVRQPAEQAPEGTEDYKAKFEALTTEFESVRQRAEEADKYKALSESDPYDGNSDLTIIAKLAKDGVPIDTAMQYIKMDLTKMSPFEKKVLSEQLNTPGVSKEKIEKYVKQQYGLGEYAPEVDGEQNEQDGLDRLEIEVAKKGGIDETLAKQKEELVTTAAKPRSEVSKELSQKELSNEWSKSIPEISTSLKDFEVKVEGIEAPIKITLDGYGQDKLNQYIEQVAKTGYKPTKENLEYMKSQIMKDAFYENREKFALEIAKATNGKLSAEIYQELHNPSKGGPSPAAPVKKTPKEELAYALANMK